MNTATAPEVKEFPPARVFTFVFVLAMLLVILGPYGNVSPIGTLDPWIYTGYFLNFSDLVDRFGHTYYVSRAPYVYVGVVLHAIFTPTVANLLLNTLLWTGIAAPFFLIAQRFFGRAMAWLALVITFANPYVATTIGWDYPDGPSLAYAALGLWLATAPPRSWPGWLGPVLAGACWTMAVLSNLIAAFIVVSSAATVVIGRAESVKRVAMDALLIGVGALASLALWSVAAKLVVGQWNVLGPQLAQVAYARAHPEYLPNMWGRGYDWLPEAYRLLAPVAVFLAGIVLLVRWRSLAAIEKRILLGGIAGIFLAAGAFAWQEFAAHKVLLRVAYHSSYLAVPTVFLLIVVCGLGWPRSAGWPSVKLALVLLGGLGPFLWRCYGSQPLATHSWLVAFACAFVALAALAWRRTTAVGMAACFFAVSYALCRDQPVSTFSIRPKEAVLLPDSTEAIRSGRAVYQLEVASDLMVLIKNTGGRDRPIRFWYDQDEPQLNLYHSLYSLYLWGHSDVGETLRNKPVAELRSYLPDHGRLLHLTSNPERIRARRELLEAHGYSWNEIGSWPLGRRGARNRVILDEVFFK